MNDCASREILELGESQPWLTLTGNFSAVIKPCAQSILSSTYCFRLFRRQIQQYFVTTFFDILS